jgi:hypothetical protein
MGTQLVVLLARRDHRDGGREGRCCGGTLSGLLVGAVAWGYHDFETGVRIMGRSRAWARHGWESGELVSQRA